MSIKASKVIGWIDTNLPPLTWRILAMKQMKLMMSHKVFPARIDDTTIFNEEIVTALRDSIKKDYGKDLPMVI